RAERGSSSVLYQEAAFLHNLPPIYPDIELASDHIDMRAGVPLRSGVLTVWVAKSDVNAGELLVLQYLADHVGQFNICANSKLTHAVTIFIRVRVRPEILLQHLVLAKDLGDAIVSHTDGQ